MREWTPEDIRDAAMDGQIRRVPGFVSGIQENGTAKASVASAVASTITYNVQPMGTSLLVEQAALQGVKPHNRQYENGRIRPMKIGDYVEIVIFGAGTPNDGLIHVYHQGTEKPDPHDCDGNRLEIG